MIDILWMDVRKVIPKFTNVPKQKWRREVPLNIGLLERYDFAGKDVLHFQLNAMLFTDRPLNETEGKQRRLRARAHGGNPEFTTLDVFRDVDDVRYTPDDVGKDGRDFGDGGIRGVVWGNLAILFVGRVRLDLDLSLDVIVSIDVHFGVGRWSIIRLCSLSALKERVESSLFTAGLLRHDGGEERDKWR